MLLDHWLNLLESGITGRSLGSPHYRAHIGVRRGLGRFLRPVGMFARSAGSARSSALLGNLTSRRSSRAQTSQMLGPYQGSSSRTGSGLHVRVGKLAYGARSSYHKIGRVGRPYLGVLRRPRLAPGITKFRKHY